MCTTLCLHCRFDHWNETQPDRSGNCMAWVVSGVDGVGVVGVDGLGGVGSVHVVDVGGVGGVLVDGVGVVGVYYPVFVL